MARRGFLRRILDAFRPTRSRPPVTPPSPSRRTPSRREGDPLRQIWNQENASGSYRRNRDVFDALPVMYEDDDEREEMWRSYVRNMVNKEPGMRYNTPDNPFWSDIGLHPRNFDWQAWRATKSTN